MYWKNALVGACVVACAAPLPARAQQVLDQQFTRDMAPANLGSNVNEGEKLVGQTFAAGLTGRLERVSTAFYRFGSAQTDFEFTVRATSGGMPVGAPLATEVLPFSAVPVVPPLGSMFDVLFDPAPLVQAGQRYALVVQSPLVPPGGGQGTGIWAGSTTPGYLAGTPVSSDDAIQWSTYPDYDLFFRTYVTVPEPASIALLALGLALAPRRRRATGSRT